MPARQPVEVTGTVMVPWIFPLGEATARRYLVRHRSDSCSEGMFYRRLTFILVDFEQNR